MTDLFRNEVFGNELLAEAVHVDLRLLAFRAAEVLAAVAVFAAWVR